MMVILSRIWPHLLVVAAVLGTLWYFDHRGYQRARADAEMDAAKVRAQWQADLRAAEHQMNDRIDGIGRTVGAQVAGIRQVSRTIVQPTLMKEIATDARYSNPAAGISQQLLDALNAARASSACTPAADGGIVCTLPEPVADPRPGDGTGTDGDGAGHP